MRRFGAISGLRARLLPMNRLRLVAPTNARGQKLRAIRGRKDLGPRLVVENHREPHGMAESLDGPVPVCDWE
jgi:hypothetical protein